MQVYDWSSIPREDMNPLFSRQVIHADTMTVARVYLKKGCLVPVHSHHNEQISMMMEGRLKFVIDGQEVVLNPGEALRIPPHVPHSAEALDDCIATDLFSPPRADWQTGDDAYLRG
jgi:quercetin dioxygenase-like cupin family protein